MALLNEIPYHTGEVTTYSSIAYVEQEPIVFSGTIKELITFGQQFDKVKFDGILEAVDFYADIDLFYNGIHT